MRLWLRPASQERERSPVYCNYSASSTSTSPTGTPIRAPCQATSQTTDCVKTPRPLNEAEALTKALNGIPGPRATTRSFRNSFKGWAREHDVDEKLSEFTLAHVEGSATVAAYARDDLFEKRRPVMQRWADAIG